MRARSAGWFVAAILAGVLSGCGGPSASVSCDQSSLTFHGFTSAPVTQAMSCTLTADPGSYYVLVVENGPQVFDVDFSASGPTTGTVSFVVFSPQAGTRTGSFTFKLCTDEDCNHVAWSRDFSYTMTVFEIDDSTIALSGNERGTPAAGSLAVSPADTGRLLTASAVTADGGGWLSVTHDSDASFHVEAAAAALAAGSHAGTVRIQFASGDAPALEVPVTFALASGIVAPSATSFDLTRSSTAASLAGSTPVRFHGSLAPAWTASSDRDWLVVAAGSGTGAGTLGYAVDTSKLGALPNWSSDTAQVTVHAAGLTDVTFPITLNKKLPEVYVVSPSAVPAGHASTVRITGRGLLQLTGAAQVDVGGHAATGGQILSDTQARLDLPALSAGRPRVSVPNAAGVAAWSGALAVAQSSSLSSATASSSGEIRSAVFDPSRNALYAVNLTENKLLRFRLNGGSWQVDALPVTDIGDLGMAPDRSRLYVGSGANSLLEVDPDLLTVSQTRTVTTGNLLCGRYMTQGMPVSANLRLWYACGQWTGLYFFDLVHATFGVQPQTESGFYSPTLAGSPDGSMILISEGGISPTPPTLLYAAATDALTAPGAPYFSFAALFDDASSKVLLDDTDLYSTSDYALIGSLPRIQGIGLRALLSPDGKRVYRFVSADTNSFVVDHVDVHDATALQPGTSSLLKLGEIPVTSQAFYCDPINPPYGCGIGGRVVISPLGDTIFWVGNRGLIVIPIPSSLSGL